jgi:uncharacterized protein YkwD
MGILTYMYTQNTVHTRYIYALLLCMLLVTRILTEGCSDLDNTIGEGEPITDEAFYTQLTAYTGQSTDWSEELHAVALQALEEMKSAASLDKEILDTLMRERGLTYVSFTAKSAETDRCPPQYDSTELRESLSQGFSEENWLGALATVQTEDGGTLLLVITADMIDPTVGQLRKVSKKIWMLANAYRRDKGLPTLEWDNTAARIAQAKTEEMYTHGYFEHISPVTGDLAAQFLTFGGLTWETDIQAMGENIAMINGYNENYKEAPYWIDLWINSPEHRDNLLCEEYTRMGVSVYQGTDGSSYAAQEFLTYMLE